MKVSRAIAKDIPQLVEVANAAYSGQSNGNLNKCWTSEADLVLGPRIKLETMEEHFQNPNFQFLKCTNDHDQIIGCISIKRSPEDRRAHLGLLSVRPDLQTGGIGKKLMRGAEGFAQEDWGCPSVTITVISVRPELLSWYGKQGYFDTGERRPFDEATGCPKMFIEYIVMEKVLS